MKINLLKFFQPYHKHKNWQLRFILKTVIFCKVLVFCLSSVTIAQDITQGTVVRVKCIKNPFNPKQLENVKIYKEPDAFSQILFEKCNFKAIIIKNVQQWVKIDIVDYNIIGYINNRSLLNLEETIKIKKNNVLTSNEQVKQKALSKVKQGKKQNNEQPKTSVYTPTSAPITTITAPLSSSKSVISKKKKKKEKRSKKKQLELSNSSAKRKKNNDKICTELFLKMSSGETLSLEEQKIINHCL